MAASVNFILILFKEGLQDDYSGSERGEHSWHKGAISR